MSERIIYKYVAVLGLDGMGNFNREADTPNIDRIFENGAKTYYALSMNPTISAENWGGMLLGTTPVVHGLTNSIVGNREYVNDDIPSVFKRIRKEHPDAVLHSFCNWNPINHGIIEHDLDVRMETADNDKLLCEKIIPAISEKPEFLFVQFDDIDGAGHHYCYGTPEQHKVISEIDGYVGAIYDEYERLGMLDDTLFVVLADHGGRIHSHGGYSDTEKYIFAGARGKGIVNSEIEYMQTRDISSIVLYALGLEYPEFDSKGYSSQIPLGIFPWFDKEYYREEAHPYNPIFKPTPAFDSENGLASFFDKDKIKLACFFDNNLKDETGKCNLKEYGICKYYSDGVRNERIELGSTGFAEIEGLSIGENSFTVSMWIKLDRSMPEEPAIIANKCWDNGNRNTTGFSAALRSDDLILNIGCDGDDFDIVTPFPDSISNGWVHATVAVDKENKKVRVYFNFELCHTVELEPQYLVNLDNLPFGLGTDGKGVQDKIKSEFIFNIDDLFVFDGAFSEEDINKLKEYYN